MVRAKFDFTELRVPACLDSCPRCSAGMGASHMPAWTESAACREEITER